MFKATQVRRQDSVTEGHKQISERNKNFTTLNSREWTKKQRFHCKIPRSLGKKKGLYLKNARIFTISGLKTTKKVFISKTAQIFSNSGLKTKKRVITAKFAKKLLLLTNSGVITSILGVSGLELHSGIEPVAFFVAISSLEGAQFSFGGKSSDLGDAQPRNAPPPRGAGPVATITCMFNLLVSLHQIRVVRD